MAKKRMELQFGWHLSGIVFVDTAEAIDAFINTITKAWTYHSAERFSPVMVHRKHDGSFHYVNAREVVHFKVTEVPDDGQPRLTDEPQDATL